MASVPTYNRSILPQADIGARPRTVFEDSPGVATVSRQELGTVVSDGGRREGALADRIDKLVSFELARESERAQIEGAKEGAAAGAEPGFATRDEMTIRAQAFNKAGLQSAAQRFELDARNKINELEFKHRRDPQAFMTESAAFEQSAAREVPAEIRLQYNLMYRGLSQPALNRVRVQAEAFEHDKAKAAFNAAYPDQLASIQKNAQSSATDPAAAVAVEQDLQRLEGNLVYFGPKEAFEFNGKQYPADPTRAGAFPLEQMVEKYGKTRDEARENGELGKWKVSPKTREWIESWKAAQLDPKTGSPLREEQVQKLSNAMYADLAKIHASQEVDRSFYVKLVDDDLASRAARGTGVEGVSEARTLELLGPVAAAQYRQKAKLADDAYAFRNKVQYMTPADRQAEVLKFEPAAGAPGYHQQQEFFKAQLAVVADIEKAIKEDPAAFVLGMPNIAGAGGKVDREKSFEAQRHVGVPTGEEWFLTKGDVERIKQRATALTGQQKGNFINDLRKEFGKDWPYAVRDLQRGKLPEELIVLSTVSDPAARAQLADAQTQGADALAKVIGNDKKKDIDGQVESKFDEFARSFAYSADGQKITARQIDSAKLLAYRYAAGGDTPTKAAQKAVEHLATNDYDFIKNGAAGAIARAPKGQGRQYEAYGSLVLDRLKPSDIDTPTADPATGLTQAQTDAEYLKSVQRGNWVASPDDEGWIRRDEFGNPVYRRVIVPGSLAPPPVPAQKSLIESGNVDLAARPRLPTGKYAELAPRAFNVDGQEVLLSTIGPDGERLTAERAIESYKATGQHLGKFKSQVAANAYGKELAAYAAALNPRMRFEPLGFKGADAKNQPLAIGPGETERAMFGETPPPPLEQVLRQGGAGVRQMQVIPRTLPEARPWYAPPPEAPAAAPAAPAPGARSAAPAALIEHVAKWEKFQPNKFFDVVGDNIGYGTAARGRETITEPEARRELVGALDTYLAEIDRINPNLPAGIRNALASLAFNTGGAWLHLDLAPGDRRRNYNEAGGLNLRGLIAAGELDKARERFMAYVNTRKGERLEGLANRRRDELAKFWPKGAG